jgi:hypothetical protein
MKGLELLRADVSSVFASMSSSSEFIVLFNQFASILLETCNLVLINHFTARAFVDAQGLAMLCYILRQQPSLPKSLLNAAIICLETASYHFDLASSLFESSAYSYDSNGVAYADVTVSGYQSLIFLLGNLKPHCEDSVAVIERIVNYAALYDVCCQLQALSSSILDSQLHIIAEALSWRLSSTSATICETFNANLRALPQQYSDGPASSSVSSDASYKKAVELVESTGKSLVQLLKLLKQHMHKKLFDAKIVNLFLGTYVMASFASIFMFIQSASELAAGLNWQETSRSSSQLISDLHKLANNIMVDWLCYSNVEILISSSADSVSLLNQITSQQTSPLVSQSLDECCSLSNQNPISDCSIGWLMHFLALAMIYIDRITSSIPSSQSLLSESSFSSWLASDSLATAVTHLEEISLSAAGRSAVSRVVSLYLFEPLSSLIVNALRIISEKELSELDASNCDNLRKLVNMLAISYLSNDLIVRSVYHANESANLMMQAIDKVVNVPQSSSSSSSSTAISSLCDKILISSYKYLQTYRGLDVYNYLEHILPQLSSSPSPPKMSQLLIIDEYIRQYSTNLSLSASSHDMPILDFTKLVDMVAKFSFGCLDLMRNDRKFTPLSIVDDVSFPIIYLVDDIDLLEENIDISPGIKAYASLQLLLRILVHVTEIWTYTEQAFIAAFLSNLSDDDLNAILFTDSLTKIAADRELCDSSGVSARLIHQHILSSLVWSAKLSSPQVEQLLVRLACSARQNPLLIESSTNLTVEILTALIVPRESHQSDLTESGEFFDTNLTSKATERLTTFLTLNTSSIQVRLKEVQQELSLFTAAKHNISKDGASSHALLVSSDLLRSIDSSPVSTSIAGSSLLEMILFIMISSSKALNDSAVELAMKLALLLDHASSMALAQILSSELDKRASTYQLLVTRLNSSSSKLSIPQSWEFSALSRWLIATDLWLQSSYMCVLLVDAGIVDVLFRLVEANQSMANNDVLLLALQCFTSLYRSLRAIATTFLSSSDDTTLKGLARLMHNLDIKLTAVLPKLLLKQIESAHWELISQAVILVSLLPVQYIRVFVQSSANAIASIEVIAVKLWLALEEGYQQLIESTDIRRNILSLISDGSNIDLLPAHIDELLSIDSCESIISAKHQAFAASAHALRLILDIAYSCYLRDVLPLASLARAIRSSMLLDPRKLTLRLQRAYTMWATEFSSAQVMLSGPRESARGAEGSSNILHYEFPQLHIFNAKHSNQRRDLYESSHFLSTSSLRLVADIVSKASKFVLNKEDKASVLAAGGDVDLAIAASSDLLMDSLSIESINTLIQMNAFHRNFQRGCLTDTVQKLFDNLRSNSTSQRDLVHEILRHRLIDGDEDQISVYEVAMRKVNANVFKSISSKFLAVEVASTSKKRKRKARVTNQAQVPVPPSSSSFNPPPVTSPPIMTMPMQPASITHFNSFQAPPLPPQPPPMPMPMSMAPPPQPPMMMDHPSYHPHDPGFYPPTPMAPPAQQPFHPQQQPMYQANEPFPHPPSHHQWDAYPPPHPSHAQQGFSFPQQQLQAGFPQQAYGHEHDAHSNQLNMQQNANGFNEGMPFYPMGDNPQPTASYTSHQNDDAPPQRRRSRFH